ncbi:c-type cytochrome [Arenibacter lacus]|uniref:c-type cytochrome n=1 Tax=Arenibacter lacus TaxID=2608629 RepID=UPI00123DD6B5|nr:cytochrome c [Arenibacter lacus]
MKHILLLGVMVMTISILVSCEYNYEVETQEMGSNECDIVVSYSNVIRPLIANNCMPCHSGDGNEPFAPDLRTYNQVNGIAGLIKEVTQSRRMPKDGSLSNEEINAIKCWVDQGAENN